MYTEIYAIIQLIWLYSTEVDDLKLAKILKIRQDLTELDVNATRPPLEVQVPNRY